MFNYIKVKTPYVQRTHWAIKQYFHNLQILQSSRKKKGGSLKILFEYLNSATPEVFY